MAALIPALIKLFLDSRRGGKGGGYGGAGGKPERSDAEKSMYYLDLDARKDAIRAKAGRVDEVRAEGAGVGWDNFQVPRVDTQPEQ